MARGDFLRDVYEEVQRRKQAPWEPSSEVVEQIGRRLAQQLGREPTSGELKAALDGIGWVARMLDEFGIPPDDALDVPELIANNTAVNLERAQSAGRAPAYSQRQAISAGVGAGFLTGLYVGLLYSEERDGTN